MVVEVEAVWVGRWVGWVGWVGGVWVGGWAGRRGEQIRVLSREQHAAVKAALWYDKRLDGNHGRALLVDVPFCDLLANDRLEPSRELMDVAAFDQINEFPTRAVFWRTSAETVSRHRCPLFRYVICLTVAPHGGLVAHGAPRRAASVLQARGVGALARECLGRVRAQSTRGSSSP